MCAAAGAHTQIISNSSSNGNESSSSHGVGSSYGSCIISGCSMAFYPVLFFIKYTASHVTYKHALAEEIHEEHQPTSPCHTHMARTLTRPLTLVSNKDKAPAEAGRDGELSDVW